MNNSIERRKINGVWVQALRKHQGITQQELAEALGLSLSTVARWEIKAFRPSKMAARSLLAYAESHHVDLEKLFAQSGSPVIEQGVQHEPRSG